MTRSRVWTVVSTNWLKSQIGNQVQKQAPRNLRILDTSFVFDKTVDMYSECYLKGHIPQSVHFNIFQCADSRPEVPVNIPDTNCFTEYVQTLGVWPDTHVVAYDRFGPMSAYRTWWLFRLFGHSNISVLDGGLRKWLEDGHDVTTEEPEIQKSDFVAKFNTDLIRNLDDVVYNSESNKEQLVDARAPESDSCHHEEVGGIIKGSKHVDFGQLFENGLIKSEEQLKALFETSGVDVHSPMMISCLTGMTACGVAAAAHILGKDVPVYYGSWKEFHAKGPSELKTKTRPPAT